MFLHLTGPFIGTRAWLAGCLAASIALAACESSNGPQPQVAARLDVVAGDGQEGRVATELANPLVVRVLDERGKPVAGQIVNFRVVSGGGSVFAGTGQTNAEGEARERWTLGTSTAVADSQRVEVRAVDAATGAPLVFATFRATATPDVPVSVAPQGSAARAGVAGEAVGDSLVVRVADRHGNPVPGVAVTWAAGAGGSISPGTSATRADGTARAQWTLGGGAGPQGATAAVAGLAGVGFTATAGAAGVARVEASPESIRFDAIGQTQALTVAAFDRFGNPVQGAAAQLVSLDAAVVALDGATARAAGNGTGRVVATVPGSLGADTITVVVQQVVTAVAPVGSTGRSGAAGEPVGDSLVVRVTDRNGNGVAGVTVTWAAGAGGSLSPGTSATRADGTARAQWTLGGAAGAQGATARVDGLQAVAFTATAGAAGVARFEASPESIRFNAIGHTRALTVAAFDRFGNPVQGAAAQLVSLDAAVVALDGAMARATGNGTSRIVATVAGSPGADTITVVVQQVAATVTISAGPAALTEGESFQLVAAVADSNDVAIPSRDVRWSSTAPSVATVDGSGLVTAVGGGEATISAAVDPAVGSRRILAVGAFRAVSIDLGGLESCAVDGSGAAYCWGYEAEYGQIGAYTPRERGSAMTFVAFTVGGAHRCGVSPTKLLYCWGVNDRNQIGSSIFDARCRLSLSYAYRCVTSPVQPEGGAIFAAASAGDDHTCGVATDGAAYCWGLNEHGQLGTLVADSTCGIESTGGPDLRPCGNSPRPVSGGYEFRIVSAGGNHSCGVATNGAAYCWGANDSGQLGNGGTTGSRTPVRAAASLTFTSIDAGQHHTCGVSTGGDVYCWGANGSGQLGDGGVAARSLPVRVGSSGMWRAVSAGRLHTCGIATSGAALCWGTNADGQIGDGSTGGQRRTPTPVAGGLQFTAIRASGGFAGRVRDGGNPQQQGHTCGIAAEGLVYCWGGNEYAQLGDGTTVSRPAPVRLPRR